MTNQAIASRTRVILRDDIFAETGRNVLDFPSGVTLIGDSGAHLYEQMLSLGLDDGRLCFIPKTRVHLDSSPRYHRNITGEVMFIEWAERITFDREYVSDDDLIAALHHAAATFSSENKVSLSGDDEVFTQRMAKLATRLGYEVKNKELQGYIESIRPPKVVPFRRRA